MNQNISTAHTLIFLPLNWTWVCACASKHCDLKKRMEICSLKESNVNSAN